MNPDSTLDPEDDAPDLATLGLNGGEWSVGNGKVSLEEGKAAFRRALAEKHRYGK